jgi:hypothetical protein
VLVTGYFYRNKGKKSKSKIKKGKELTVNASFFAIAA